MNARGGEGFEAAGPGCAGADVAGDVARNLLLAYGVLPGGLEHGVDVVDVGECQRREQLVAALAGGAAAGWSRRASMPCVQHWQVVRSWLSQVRTSLAVSLVSFFLPRPGMKNWWTQVV